MLLSEFEFTLAEPTRSETARHGAVRSSTPLLLVVPMALLGVRARWELRWHGCCSLASSCMMAVPLAPAVR